MFDAENYLYSFAEVSIKNLAKCRSDNFVRDYQNNYVERLSVTMLQKVLTFQQSICVSYIIILIVQTKLFSDSYLAKFFYFSKTVLSECVHKKLLMSQFSILGSLIFLSLRSPFLQSTFSHIKSHKKQFSLSHAT